VRFAALRLPCLSLTGALALFAAEARAIDVVTVGDDPITVDVTNTAIFGWHFDNRNDTQFNPSSQIDDRYGEWLDRLNLQISWWRLRLGLRFDAATYVDVTSYQEAAELADANFVPTPGASPNEFRTRYYRALHTRFLNTYYPAKLWLGYTQPGLDVTAGDFYAQLGRGLVLSVRKIDELVIDTTIRGGKIAFDHSFGKFKIGATALAGQLNPLRIDETSGRRLHGDGSPLFFGYPEISDFCYADPNNPAPIQDGCNTFEPSQPSYLEDTVYGGRVEAGTDDVLFAANGSLLRRKPGPEPRDTVRTFSGSINIPSIAKVADLYVEVAGQQHRDGHLLEPAEGDVPEKRVDDLSGYAIYASGGVRAGPFALSLEGKHYRSLLPLTANIDVNNKAFGAPEFSLVAYNQPPTAESTYVEQIGSPNVCITGGRAKVDVKLAKAVSLFAWAGHFVSFTEHDASNETCDTSDRFRTTTWDVAAGDDISFEGGKSHAIASIGARLTDRPPEPEPDPNLPLDPDLDTGRPTDVFYREGYLRYDLVKHIAGPFSVQFQGIHRHRYEPMAVADSWNEGENNTAIHWSPHLAATFGYEYSTRTGCDPDGTVELCHYFNGTLQWRSGADDSILSQIFDTVQVFVGQRRGGIRCVSGVCRNFPPLEGARLEIVSRL
jgi:hypothetical protein